jgi:hypothetical protein
MEELKKLLGPAYNTYDRTFIRQTDISVENTLLLLETQLKFSDNITECIHAGTKYRVRTNHVKTLIHEMCDNCFNVWAQKTRDMEMLKKLNEISLGIKHLVAAKDKDELKDLEFSK